MDRRQKSLDEFVEIDAADIECDPEQYEAGSGGFGDVIYGYCKSLKKRVAVKIFLYAGGKKEKTEMLEKIKEEMKYLHKAEHKNIVHVYGWVKWGFSVGIVMEFCERGNLRELLLDLSINLGIALRVRILLDIATALDFCHALGDERLIHGDVKPENSLMTTSIDCKLGDFGSADMGSITGSIIGSTTFECSPTSRKKPQYTIYYAAPEKLTKPNMKPTRMLDIYAFALLIHMVLTRKKPYGKCDDRILLNEIKAGLRPSYKEEIHEWKKSLNTGERKMVNALVKLMEQCWVQNPSDRPQMREITSRLQELLSQVPPSVIMKQATTVAAKLEETYFRPNSASKPMPLFMFSPRTNKFEKYGNPATEKLNSTDKLLPGILANPISDDSGAAFFKEQLPRRAHQDQQYGAASTEGTTNSNSGCRPLTEEAEPRNLIYPLQQDFDPFALHQNPGPSTKKDSGMSYKSTRPTVMEAGQKSSQVDSSSFSAGSDAPMLKSSSHISPPQMFAPKEQGPKASRVQNALLKHSELLKKIGVWSKSESGQFNLDEKSDSTSNDERKNEDIRFKHIDNLRRFNESGQLQTSGNTKTNPKYGNPATEKLNSTDKSLPGMLANPISDDSGAALSEEQLEREAHQDQPCKNPVHTQPRSQDGAASTDGTTNSKSGCEPLTEQAESRNLINPLQQNFDPFALHQNPVLAPKGQGSKASRAHKALLKLHSELPKKIGFRRKDESGQFNLDEKSDSTSNDEPKNEEIRSKHVDNLIRRFNVTDQPQTSGNTKINPGKETFATLDRPKKKGKINRLSTSSDNLPSLGKDAMKNEKSEDNVVAVPSRCDDPAPYSFLPRSRTALLPENPRVKARTTEETTSVVDANEPPDKPSSISEKPPTEKVAASDVQPPNRESTNFKTPSRLPSNEKGEMSPESTSSEVSTATTSLDKPRKNLSVNKANIEASLRTDLCQLAPVIEAYVQHLRNGEYVKSNDLKQVVFEHIKRSCRASAGDLKNRAEEMRSKNNSLEAILFYRLASEFYLGGNNAETAAKGVEDCSWGLKTIAKDMFKEPTDSQAVKYVVKYHLLLLMHNMRNRIKRLKNLPTKVQAVCEALCLHYIERVQDLVGDRVKQEETIKQALRLIERQFGKNAVKSKVYGDLLHNMGIVCHESSRLQEAAEYYKRALEAHRTAELVSDEDRHRRIAATESNLNIVADKIREQATEQ